MLLQRVRLLEKGLKARIYSVPLFEHASPETGPLRKEAQLT